MPYCPECGGEMLYISRIKQYSCKNCGLTLTLQELIEVRESLRRSKEVSEEEERKKLRREYLQWWLSKKE